ncbi:MAG TPA: Ig-like domain-containing protein [Candidatus Ozemobacteraceae bacterium]
MRNNRRGKANYRWVPALLVLLAVAGTVFGTPTNPTITLTSDVNGDGIAGVGDTITMSCRSSNVTEGDTPYVNASLLGNAHFTLANIVSTYYSAIYGPLTKGTLDTTGFKPTFIDNTGQADSNTTIPVDVQPPICPMGITIQSSYAHGTGGIYKSGDSLNFTLTFTDADGLAGGGRLNVFADLSTLGLGTNVPLTGPTGLGVYTFNQLLPTGRERNADTFSVLAVDDAGNKQTFAGAISYDTREPEIESVVATNVSGGSVVKIGDQVKLTVVISNYDNDKVTASQSILFGTSKPVLTKKSGTIGSSATFEYLFTVNSGTNLEDTSWIQFQVYATDDAGNQVEGWSNALAYDTLPPGFADAQINIIDNTTNAIKTSNIAIIDDTLRFTGNLTSLPTDVTLTVDLSGIGGVSNQIIPTSPATTSFSFDFKVFQGTSEDYTPRAFTITAKDNGGNTVYQIAMPVMYVDNQPPVLSSAQLSKISTGLATAKLNDTIAVQANVVNIDGGEVWVDFQNIGGSAIDLLSSSGGSTYRLEKTVLAPLPGFTAIDSSRTFVIRAKDNAGNIAQITTPALSIDNEPPVFTLATWTVQPDLSSSHPYVRANDILTFQATLAGSGLSTPHDSETVTINLTALGGSANQALTFDGGVYSYQMTVPAGTVNNLKSFTFTAKDNADNADARNVSIPIDNYSPVVGPMTITTLTDVNKVGVMNVGDTYEFAVPCDDPDGGRCTIDLSLLGSSSMSLMEYDPTLKRYFTTVTASGASIEQTGYVFRALVTDKAGNTMSSLASAKTVDCVMPVIYSASARFQDLVGSPTCANVGDKITITADVELTRLDNGTPKVNLTAIGGAAAQPLYDDGAHDDGGAGDGIFGFTQTVAAGSTNGVMTSFLVELVDDAGNRAQAAAPETIFVDNQPLTISSFVASQSYDNNGNSVVDLDGVFTTYPIVATDMVKLTINVLSGSADPGSLTVDLTPLGIQNTAYELRSWTPISGGRSYSEEFTLRPGTINGVATKFTATLTDVNGNQTWAQSAQALTIDNLAPSIIVYPISFVVDNGRVGEANEGDVIRIKVRVTNHDGILPMIDFEKLYLDNGLSAPSPTLFPPTGGPNEYSYDWTVPAGLGTTSPITILAYDVSKNMTVGYSEGIRFLSRIPTFKAYPATRVELSKDIVPQGYPNRIANPPNAYNAPAGDELTFTAVLSSVYNTTNTPAATVLVDIRPLVSSTDDDSDQRYADGDFNTYWYPLTYRPAISGGGNYVYSASYTVEAGLYDIVTASFPVRVLHPDVNSIVMATTQMQCNPLAKFGIDSQIPVIQQMGLNVVTENSDNVSSATLNIGDVLNAWAEISDIPDYYAPASVSALISNGGTTFLTVPLSRSGSSQIWSGSFAVATATVSVWPALSGQNITTTIVVNDDALNFTAQAQVSTFTIDNVPPVIQTAALSVTNTKVSPNQQESWVANVGDGYETLGDGIPADCLVASVTVVPPANNVKAWIDLSPILGTSTFELTSTGGGLLNIFYNETGYSIATLSSNLATPTFTVWVRDSAGNRANTTVQVAIDTVRPSLVSASYDGTILSLRFNETIRLQPNTFDQTLVRLGNTNNLTDMSVSGNPPAAVQLTGLDTVLTMTDSDVVDILVSSSTQAVIADWGSSSLWIAMGHLSDTDLVSGEAPSNDTTGYIGRDLAGNWITPLPRASFTKVTVTTPYAIRPKLAGGSCVVSDENQAVLYLNFDRDMNYINTITNTTLEQLAIWKNRGDASENYINRFRFRQSVSADWVDYNNSNPKTVAIQLSQTTIDWLALQYTRTSPFINLAVNDPLPTNANFNIPNTIPPLIRDQLGNRVQGIIPANATQATLVPLNSQFTINNFTLTSSGTQVLLTVDLNAATSRRARLYTDFFTSSANQVILPCTSPVSFQKIYLAKSSNMSGGSFPLTTAYVDYTQFNALNPQYASTTIRIPLNESALQTILSWGNRQIYIACEQGALVDMWGNQSVTYRNADGTAKPLNFDPTGTSAQPPRIFSVAVAPVVSNHPSDTSIQLVKGPAAAGLTYEVAFETATISNNLRLPIDQSVTPKLELRDTQTNGLIDQATFLGWTSHQMDSVTRTVAQFQNSNAFANGALQRASCTVVVSNFRDLFELTGVTHTENATQVYDLTTKSTAASGFSEPASKTLVIDNQAPKLARVAPDNVTIGITPAEAASFTLTFDEAMNAQIGYLPSAYLKSGSTAITLRCTGSTDSPSNRTFRFVNTQAISGIEGTFQFVVSSALDEAGNAYADTTATGTINIRAKGPVLSKYEIRSTQETTGRSDLNMDYSPYATLTGQPTNLATISVFFTTGSAGETYWLHLVQNGSTIASRSFIPAITGDGLVGNITWDGKQKFTDATPIDGRYSYELRVYDSFFNEGSIRSTLVYDSKAPQMSQWKISHGGPVRTGDTMTFFNPQIHSYVKIDAIGASDGGTVYLRTMPLNPGMSTATQTYAMSPLTPSGKTLSFNGRTTDNSTFLLDGEYWLNLVDGAGNVLGTPYGRLFIDTVGPNIASLSMALTGGAPITTRYNPRVDSLVISVTTDDTPDVSSGPAYIRIKQGSTVIRDLELPAPNGYNYSVTWDGKKAPPSTEYVGEGQYQLTVIDRAENQGVNNSAVYTTTLDIITSGFGFTAVKQTGSQTLLLTFSHDVDPQIEELQLVNRFLLLLNPGDLTGAQPEYVTVDGKTVTLTFDQGFEHNHSYTMKVMDGFTSIDGDRFTTPQVQTFTADAQGPQIAQITFDGVANAQEFNVVFDEIVNASTATTLSNYTLTASGSVIELDPARIFLRADNRSVRLKSYTNAHIKEGILYTLTAKNIRDTIGNIVTTQSVEFEGRDVTPPAIKDNIFVFSNPANPLDITIVVQSNESLSEAPTAAVSQDGGTAQTIKLQASSSNPKLFMGGVHLTKAGTASIKVTATDMTGNKATETVSFATAYVNASVLASVSTPDKAFIAQFAPGSLKQDSIVAVIPTPLQKQARTASVRGGIRPSFLAGINAAEKQTLRFATAGGDASEELSPVETGYTVTIPTGQLANSYLVSMALPGGALPAGAGLYQAMDNGWVAVTGTVKEGRILATVSSAGTFALLRDTLAPRASLVTKIEAGTALRNERPTFEWSIVEEGSGLAEDGVKVVIDGTETAGRVVLEGGKASFIPLERLVDGSHELVMKVKDRAGNERVLPAVRFAIQPALQVFEIVQFPNPARSRATMRIATNRDDIDPDEIDVTIYDISGDKVAGEGELSFFKRLDGGRRVVDMAWDLRNHDGRSVANGVYLAKIKLRDPDTGKTTKVTHKIAVLR